MKMVTKCLILYVLINKFSNITITQFQFQSHFSGNKLISIVMEIYKVRVPVFGHEILQFEAKDGYSYSKMIVVFWVLITEP